MVIEISPDGSYDCTEEALRRRKQGVGSGLQRGQRVIIKGLKAKPELNGESAVVKSFNVNTSRYTVTVASRNVTVALKEQNLEKTAASHKAKAKKQAKKA